jgi:rfaE bifunctional protein nucleotidyltransferase chain/domain/rfaE bifunctional protein kinase chain/domain
VTPPRRHRLVVVGDVVLDRDLIGRSERLCPDAPVPVVDVDEVRESPGAAALTALLCLADDMDVTLVAPLAADRDGGRLAELLASAGVHVIGLPHEGGTRRKTRVRCAGQSLLRLDDGGPGTPDGDLPADTRRAIEAADIALVSDYGAGTTAHPALREVLTGLSSRRPVVWDPHPRGTSPVPGCALVTPNLLEARAVTADALGTPDVLAAALVRRWAARAVAVTAGPTGAWLSTSADEPYFVAAPVVVAADPCGAGDRFSATTAQALARGSVPSEAVAAAVADASAWVAQGGAAALRPGFRTATAAGRSAGAAHGRRPAAVHAGRHGPAVPLSADTATGPVLTPAGDAFELAAAVRRDGGTLVATGGCFDVLHAGHVASLEASARLGDAVVVLLNSDASVRRLKGPDRPVQPAHDRARVLMGLRSVDAVLVFEEDDPCAVLDLLRPDVWTKGGDYDASALPELQLVRSWGGRVILLPYLAGRSTTAILNTTS